MESAELGPLFDRNLKGVRLSGRHSNKFDALVAALADHWDLEGDQIGVKALGDTKNFGNRISETTRARRQRLVLLTREEDTREAVARALEQKALFLAPTLLVVEREGHWDIECGYLPKGEVDPFGCEVPLVVVEPLRVPAVSPETVASVRSDLLALGGAPADTDLERLLAGPDRGGRTLVSKEVPDGKNLANRIGEGLARRPAVCVFRVPTELRANAERIVGDLAQATPETIVFLVCETDTRLEIVEIEKALVDGTPLPTESRPSADRPEPRPPVKSDETVNTPDPDEPLRYRQLERVRLLLHHLPLDAGADRLYEEHAGSDERLWYETKTLDYLRGLLASEARVFVVLTGNAGHGKTHLCRRLLEDGDRSEDVMSRLASDLEGHEDWSPHGASLPTRFIKDLSELNPPARSAERLVELIDQDDAHVIVCANEGRLRDVVSHEPDALNVLLDALEAGTERGETSPETSPHVHVINLNYQAAAADGGGFLDHVLDHFLNHESGWKICGTCRASDTCPILRNRSQLAMSPSSASRNSTHREALIELVRLVEQGGYVLTYRETLVLVAYLVTGGLTCSRVEELHRRDARDELARHHLLSLLFELRLSEDEADVLRILRRIGRLDPGRVALRPIDERLHRELEEADELGEGLFGRSSSQLHTRRDLLEESTAHRARLRRARRKAWWESSDGTDDVRRTERLGLRYYHLFRSLHAPKSESEVLGTLRALVRGLHTIQGAVGVDSKTRFHLVDPAFGRSGSHAAIIARSLRIKDLEVETESRWWRERNGETRPAVLDSVEWIDRRLVLVHRRRNVSILSLDLLSFEFVMAAGDGIVMREFHSAERRRILRCLAKHAEQTGDAEDDIRILLERGDGFLTLERDGTILLEKNA